MCKLTIINKFHCSVNSKLFRNSLEYQMFNTHNSFKNVTLNLRINRLNYSFIFSELKNGLANIWLNKGLNGERFTRGKNNLHWRNLILILYWKQYAVLMLFFLKFTMQISSIWCLMLNWTFKTVKWMWPKNFKREVKIVVLARYPHPIHLRWFWD